AEHTGKDVGKWRVRDAPAAVAAVEELVEPRRRLGQPPSSVEEGLREATVVVVVGDEARARGEIDDARGRPNGDGDGAVARHHRANGTLALPCPHGFRACRSSSRRTTKTATPRPGL